MRLLLDTHMLVWLAQQPEQLRAEEARAIETADALLVSVLSIWELRMKIAGDERRGRPASVLSPAAALAFCRGLGAEVFPLLPDDPTAPLPGTIGNADPFDEMLLVHAQRLGARLLTRDRRLTGHPLAYRA
jgi:PIN domain nuclease of toxin-antitoxin system